MPLRAFGSWAVWGFAAALAVGCGDDDAGGAATAPDSAEPPPDSAVAPPDAAVAPFDAALPLPPDGGPMGFQPGSCDDLARGLFRQDVMPEFHIEISDEEWSALVAEWNDPETIDETNVKPWHRLISFRYGDEIVTDAQIQLRGNPTRWRGEKMQFEIGFNVTDRAGRFRGLRRILLDAAYYNPSQLRDRLGHWFMREVGLPAPCVNNAVLYVNGTWYGFYQHIEKVDREFLERNFPDPDGNLWKRAQYLMTNESTPDYTRIEAYHDAKDDLAALSELLDLDQALTEWAAEAVAPHKDGFWAGGWNYYLYDVPGAKFVFIPWDLDQSFNSVPYDADPVLWHKMQSNYHGRPEYDTVLADPGWFAVYLEKLEAHLLRYDAARMQALVDAWADQVRDAAARDVLAPYTFEAHLRAVEELRAYLPKRQAYLERAIACWKAGGRDVDGDLQCDPP